MNKININRKKLSNAEIVKYSDFQYLMDKYSKIPNKNPIKHFWNKLGMYVFSAGIISVLALYFFIQKNDISILNEEQALKGLFINPPIKGCDIPYKYVYYFNTSDTVINFSSTSKIEIKQNSLVDSKGAPVNGKIEIRYREFMNPAEIFLSGIPMEYDSSGVKSIFESAGMVELRAFYKGRPLYISPDKPTKISFKSNKRENDYNLYYLDTIKRNWVYKGKETITNMSRRNINEKAGSNMGTRFTKDSSITTNSLIAPIELVKPEPPVLANTGKLHFTLDVLPKEFPELTGYTKTVFEIDEKYKPLNPTHSSIEWDDVVIEKSDKETYYYVTFKKDTLKAKYLVRPVFTAKNYNQELINYAKKFAVYQNELSKRKKSEEPVNTKLAKRVTLINKTDELFQPVDTVGNTIGDINAYESWGTEAAIERSFYIMNFGIWNCDKSFKFINSRIIKPEILVNDTEYFKTIFLADISRNMLMTIYPGAEIQYDRNSKNLLWMVTENNQIAIFNNSDFAKIQNIRYSGYKLHFHKIKSAIKTPEDFIKLFRSGFNDI